MALDKQALQELLLPQLRRALPAARLRTLLRASRSRSRTRRSSRRRACSGRARGRRSRTCTSPGRTPTRVAGDDGIGRPQRARGRARSRSRRITTAAATGDDGCHPAGRGGIEEDHMGIPVRQARRRQRLSDEAEAEGQQALPARPHAGAAVSLQPRLRGLRQDPASGGRPQHVPDAGAVLGCRRRVRRAGRVDRRRRAAGAPEDRPDRGRARGAEEVRLPVHQRAAARPLAAEAARLRHT